MPSIDMPLAELERYRPELTAEPDFDVFWGRQIAASDATPTAETWFFS